MTQFVNLRFWTRAITLVVIQLLIFTIGLAVVELPIVHAATATVTVDAATSQGTLKRPEQYNSSNFASAGTIGQDALRQSELQFKVFRVWVVFDSCYNYTTDTYNFSGRYQTLENASNLADSLIINTGPKTAQDVEAGYYNLDKYREIARTCLLHYKQRYPKIEYVEALNEHIPVSPTYYDFYKAQYEAVNYVNSTLNPIKPLKIGGPVPSSFDANFIQDFLDDYAADTSPSKRLDFISYHQYLFGGRNRPSVVQNERSTLENWLSTRNLPTTIPAFVSEVGIYPGGETGSSSAATDRLTQAAGIASLDYYYSNQSDKIIPVNWVIHHSSNSRKDQMSPTDGVPYPYYNMMKMQSLMKTTRISGSSNALNNDGIGVYTIAAKDNSGVSVMTWNYQADGGTTSYDTTVNISNLPSNFSGRQIRVQRYLINSTTSNYDYDSSKALLTEVENKIVPNSTAYNTTVSLEKNALSLIVLTPGVQGEAESLTTTISSGDSQSDFTESIANNGGGANQLYANAVGDYVQYSLNVPTVGTYAVLVRSKKGNNRGKYQLSIDGSNQGAEQDLYNGSLVYEIQNLGNKDFSSTGSKNFRFSVTGKNSANTTSSYNLVFDYILLVPLNNLFYQVENTVPTTSLDDPFYLFSDSGSVGQAIKLDADEVNDFIDFNFRVTTPGTYNVVVRVKKDSTRGKFQLSINGVNQGNEQNLYASSSTYAEINLGQKNFTDAANYVFKFKVTGTTGTGYALAFDEVKLLP
jgi:hypothetical protein